MTQKAQQYINLDMQENVQRLMKSGYKYLIFGRQLPHSLIVGRKRILDYGDYVFREIIPSNSRPADGSKGNVECYTLKEVAKKGLLECAGYSFQIAAEFLQAA